MKSESTSKSTCRLPSLAIFFNNVIKSCYPKQCHQFKNAILKLVSNPANTLCKSNVILWLYFGNLRKLLSVTLVLRDPNCVKNSDVAITLAQLT